MKISKLKHVDFVSNGIKFRREVSTNEELMNKLNEVIDVLNSMSSSCNRLEENPFAPVKESERGKSSTNNYNDDWWK